MADDQRRRMRGKVFPVRGRRRPRPGARSPAPPGTWRPTVRWDRQGGSTGQRSRGRGRGRGFAARSPPPSCLAEYASVTAGRTPGVTDQDLRRSEAWLGKRRRLAGVIRAVVPSPPPQAHRRGRGHFSIRSVTATINRQRPGVASAIPSARGIQLTKSKQISTSPFKNNLREIPTIFHIRISVISVHNHRPLPSLPLNFPHPSGTWYMIESYCKVLPRN